MKGTVTLGSLCQSKGLKMLKNEARETLIFIEVFREFLFMTCNVLFGFVPPPMGSVGNTVNSVAEDESGTQFAIESSSPSSPAMTS
jgi:hypothetical protein